MGLQQSVFIADSDIADLEHYARALYQEGLPVSTFQTGPELLQGLFDTIPSCIVCEAHLEGLGASRLMDVLSAKPRYIPVIFVASHPAAAVIVEVMKRGAVDFLTKPVQNHTLVSAVQEALNRYNTAAMNYDAYQWIQSRFRNLTAREREILKFVVSGMLNKQVALELGISEKTVKVHRGRVMRKLEVQSVAELVRLSDKLASLERSWSPNSSATAIDGVESSFFSTTNYGFEQA